MPPTASEIVQGVGKPKLVQQEVPRRVIARSGSLVLYDLPWKSTTLPESIVLVPLPPKQTMSRRPPPWLKRVLAKEYSAG